MKKKIAIITGATGGVGKCFVQAMCKENLDEIWAIARNTQKLEELKTENEKVQIVPCCVDLSKKEGYTHIAQLLQEQEPQVMYLINNAGIARMAGYQDFTLEEIETTIDLNCKAPVILCQLCIPYMVEGSHILNISSASAFQPNPYINLYASSKVFERHYSRALHVELKGTGITCTAVCPSWVDTEMLVKEVNGQKVRFPGIVTAEQVVEKAIKDGKKGRDMSVCSLYVKCQHLNVKLMPQRWVMKLWMRGIRKYRRQNGEAKLTSKI